MTKDLRPINVTCPTCIKGFSVSVPTDPRVTQLVEEAKKHFIEADRARELAASLQRQLDQRTEQEEAKRNELSMRAHNAERDAATARAETREALAKLATFHRAITDYQAFLTAEALKGATVVAAAHGIANAAAELTQSSEPSSGSTAVPIE